MKAPFEILYEDNHIIAINKRPGDIVQGDQTGDEPLPEIIKRFIKERDHKPGNVYLGVIHRLDRPTSGVVLFAKTSKGLSRFTELFRERTAVRKTYHALVEQAPAKAEDHLVHSLKKNASQNKSYVVASGAAGAKQAILDYKIIAQGDHFTLLSIDLKTGRHHQIRCQLAAISCTIRGDLKYGAKRSGPGGSIALHARELQFTHPISKKEICIKAPYPIDVDKAWRIAKERH